MIPDDPFFDTTLDHFPLSAGAVHALSRERIRSIGELFEAADRDTLSLMGGIGATRQEEIMALLWKVFREQKDLHKGLLGYMDIFPGRISLEALGAWPGDILDVHIRMLRPARITENLLTGHGIATFGSFLTFPFDHVRLDNMKKTSAAEIEEMQRTLRALLGRIRPGALARCGFLYDYDVASEDDIDVADLGLPTPLAKKLRKRGLTRASMLNRMSRRELMNHRGLELSYEDVSALFTGLAAFYLIPRYERASGLLEQENAFAPWIRHLIASTARYLDIRPAQVAMGLENEKTRRYCLTANNCENSQGGGTKSCD